VSTQALMSHALPAGITPIMDVPIAAAIIIAATLFVFVMLFPPCVMFPFFDFVSFLYMKTILFLHFDFV